VRNSPHDRLQQLEALNPLHSDRARQRLVGFKQLVNLQGRKLVQGETSPGRCPVKKEDETHMQIVSADISSESLTGMVIFRPHCMSRAGRNVKDASKDGNWYALRPAEVRSFARALLDAADTLDLKIKTQQAAKSATG
jgi:hypothetical protein